MFKRLVALDAEAYWMDPKTTKDVLRILVDVREELETLIEYSSLSRDRKSVLLNFVTDIDNVSRSCEEFEFDDEVHRAMLSRCGSEDMLGLDQRKKLLKEYQRAVEFYVTEMNKKEAVRKKQ